jgi:glycosyltransferase involved in cell wall biosynthesis
MKVLLVNSLYPPLDVGGAERSVSELARGLAAAGVSVAVLSLCRAGDEGVVVEDGVEVWRARLNHLYWPWGGERRSAVARGAWHGLEAVGRTMDGTVEGALAAVRPDLVHAHVQTGLGTSVYRAARRRGLPLVQTLRDYSTICARAALFRKGRMCGRRCVDCVVLTEGRRRATAKVDHVVGISRAVLEAHRAAGCFRDTPSSVIGNAAGSGVVRRRPEGAVVFGFIGRIEPEKGIEVLLRAVVGLEGDWRLRIAGRGEPAYVAGLRAAFPDPRIEWLGQVEAGDFYGAVDAVAVPSLWAEPFGRVVVEALANGRGLIVSDIGGLPEAAAGRAVLVEAADVEGLRRAMAKMLADPVALRARGAVAPVWSQTAVVEAHLDLYASVLSSQASRALAEASQR